MDRRQRRRHRPGRARLHLPDRRLRDQLRQPADQLRHPLAGAVRPGHPAARAAGRSTSASRRKCCPACRWRRVRTAIDFKNITDAQNSLRNVDSYNRFDVVSPLDGSVIPVYDVKPEFRGRSPTSTAPATRHEAPATTASTLDFNARLPRGVRVFGGFNLERTLNDTCSAAQRSELARSTATSRTAAFRGRSSSRLRWSYPLPWWGITVSVSLQSLIGYVIGTRGAGLRRLHRRHRLRRPNGQGTYWKVTPTTRYAANCTGPCTPGELVHPAAGGQRPGDSRCRWSRRKPSSCRATTSSTSRSASGSTFGAFRIRRRWTSSTR